MQLKSLCFRRSVLAVICLLPAFVILFTGAVSPSHAGGTLRFGMYEDAISLDPIIPSDNASIHTILLIFDQLVRTGCSGESIEPGLAESWEISTDRLTYTFHLRTAHFSNGQPVTAQDVVFSLNRAAGKESRWASFYKPIKEMQAVDPQTVKLILKEPFTPIMANLAMWSASIVPRELVEKDPKAFANRPVGSGPFILKEWRKGEKLLMVKNPYYWQTGKPYVDSVDISIDPEDNTRMLKLRSGELDIAASVPFNMINTLEKAKNVDIVVSDVLRSDFILLNTTRKPFDDVRVRRALNLAVNKEQIIQTILFGMGKVAKSTLPIMRYYNHDIEPYTYNPAKAKELLAQAGFPDGFKSTMLVVSGEPAAGQAAVVIQDSLKQIGVDIQISMLEGGTHWETTKSGNYDMAMSYCTSDTLDPDQIIGFTMLTPGRADSYHTRFKNEEINQLFVQGRTTPDGPQREQIYKKLLALHYQDAPFIFLYHIPSVYAAQTNVHNFRICATSNYRLEDVMLQK